MCERMETKIPSELLPGSHLKNSLALPSDFPSSSSSFTGMLDWSICHGSLKSSSVPELRVSYQGDCGLAVIDLVVAARVKSDWLGNFDNDFYRSSLEYYEFGISSNQHTP